jgi:phage terminase large subunit
MDPDPITGDPGRIMLAMTPLRGFRWVHARYVAPPREDGAEVHQLWTEDNPHMDSDVVRRMWAKYDEDVQAARMRGDWVQLKGRVYKSFSRVLHVVDPFDIPEDWPRYRGVDFGWRNPTAIVWVAVSPDDQVVVYRAHYQSNWTTDQHAARVIELEQCQSCEGTGHFDENLLECEACGGSGEGETITGSWADPSRPDTIVDYRRRHGLRFRPAKRDFQKGIDTITERLRSKVENGQPALVVFSSCEPVIHEFETYHHVDEPRNSDGRERPAKDTDHAMDALRYVVVGLTRRFGIG